MWTSILPTSISLPNPPRNRLSSLSISSGIAKFGIFPPPAPNPRPDLAIRMGGGPRTFPGGVSKWQWKRMQAKKAKQLLKARLCRERQLYEMRKRAELKAAVAELERPWEAVERAPALFSVRADEQLQVLADRFHRPGGFDMWSERDGPQVFRTPDGLPSARFFPKDAVHSLKPYGVFSRDLESDTPPDAADAEEESRFENVIQSGRGGRSRRSREPSYSHLSDGGGYSGRKDVCTDYAHSRSSVPSSSTLGETRGGRSRRSREPSYSRLSGDIGYGDRMDVRADYAHSRGSVSSTSTFRERRDAHQGQRSEAANASGDSARSFRSGAHRNSGNRQQRRRHPGDADGLNSDFQRSQTEQT